MIDRFRSAEGADQLDLFQSSPTPHWVWRKLPFIVIGIVVGMLYLPDIFG